MSAPMTTTQFGNAVDPGVRKHWVDAFQQAEPKMTMVFRVSDQKDQIEVEAGYTGLGRLAPVAEGETISEDTPIQTYSTNYTDQKYAKLFSVSKETRMWTKTDEVVNAAKMAGKATAREVEARGASVFVNGFNTAYTSYGDGKPLFSVSHTRADGGTAQSNASATGVTFTEANIEVAQLAGEQILDDRGQLVQIYLDTALLPPALRKEGLIYAKSELRPTTAENDINVNNKSIMKYEGVGIDLIVWKYLGAAGGGSDTAWYMLDTSDFGHKVSWKWGERPKVGEMNMEVGYKTDTIYWKYGFHASTGWSDFRGVWGSKGDGQAYAS